MVYLFLFYLYESFSCMFAWYILRLEVGTESPGTGVIDSF